MKAHIFIMFFFITVLLTSSCEEGFEMNLNNKKPILIAPVNNLTTTDSMHSFYWESMEGATKYNLQVIFPRFDSAVKLITDTIITTNNLNLKLPKGEFEWRVTGKNNSSTSAFSEIWKLTIQ